MLAKTVLGTLVSSIVFGALFAPQPVAEASALLVAPPGGRDVEASPNSGEGDSSSPSSSSAEHVPLLPVHQHPTKPQHGHQHQQSRHQHQHRQQQPAHDHASHEQGHQGHADRPQHRHAVHEEKDQHAQTEDGGSFSQKRTANKAGEFPAPDIRTLKEFIAQANDYGDGSSETAYFEGPTKTCKRRRAQDKARGDDVEITVAYPHPLSDEDRAKMESLSLAYWSAVGVEPPRPKLSDDDEDGDGDDEGGASEEELRRKFFFEKVVEETEEEEVEV